MRKFLPSCTAIIALLTLCAIEANAGTLTIDPSSPSFQPSGTFSNNSITAQLVNGNLVQIFGNTDIAVTPNGFAEIFVGGTFSADSNDIFSFFYNFTANLNSAGPVEAFLQWSAGGLTVNDQFTLTQGSHTYSGMAQSLPTPEPFSGNYDFRVTFMFAEATRPGRILAPSGGGEFLQLSIPQNGLQFQIAPDAIPEPSTYALLVSGLGAVLLIARRRRLA